MSWQTSCSKWLLFPRRQRQTSYSAALKSTATPASWTEIKGAVEIAKASTVNDATIYRIIENLKAAMRREEKEKSTESTFPCLGRFYCLRK